MTGSLCRERIDCEKEVSFGKRKEMGRAGGGGGRV